MKKLEKEKLKAERKAEKKAQQVTVMDLGFSLDCDFHVLSKTLSESISDQIVTDSMDTNCPMSNFAGVLLLCSKYHTWGFLFV